MCGGGYVMGLMGNVGGHASSSSAVSCTAGSAPVSSSEMERCFKMPGFGTAAVVVGVVAALESASDDDGEEMMHGLRRGEFDRPGGDGVGALDERADRLDNGLRNSSSSGAEWSGP